MISDFNDFYCCVSTILFLYSNRKSLILEEDLKYLDEMDSSVFDRLKQFKETESKSKEDMEVTLYFFTLASRQGVGKAQIKVLSLCALLVVCVLYEEVFGHAYVSAHYFSVTTFYNYLWVLFV